MNPNISRIEPSLIRQLNAKKRPGDIDLGLGEPTLAPDLESFGAALEWTRTNGSPYSPNAGFAELRTAIADYLADDLPALVDARISAGNVCVTVGSEEALYLAIRTVIDPAHDEVLIVEPSYLAYVKICVLEGISHRTVALDPENRFKPDAARVLSAVTPRTKLIILNTPSNPTGRIWPDDQLQALADGLAETGNEIWVLADEVYRELHYSAERPASIGRFHPQTLIAGSLSKSNALTGLRLGWLAGPAEIVAAATKVHQFVNTAASTFSQRVALELFSRPGSLASHRPSYVRTRTGLIEAVSQAGLEAIPPEGTFYLFFRLPKSLRRDSTAVAERILEDERVVTVPGRAFGPSGEGWLRLSWVAPADRVEEGIRRIGKWLRKNGS